MSNECEEFDCNKFQIYEPSKITNDDHDNETESVSPPTFQRGESFLRRFMAPSNPGSRVGTQPSTPNTNDVKTPDLSPPPTLPSSPCTDDPPTPDTAPFDYDYESTLLDIPHPVNKTPANSTRTTPSVSKRSTATTFKPHDLEHVSNSSMIVPVMIPDKTGNLVNDELKINMVVRFGILVSDYKKVFSEKMEPTTTTKTKTRNEPTLNRRRSMTLKNIENTKPTYLLIDQPNPQERTQSSDRKVNVRLLLSVSDLCQFPSVRMSGEALRAILNDTRDRMSRRPRRHTSDMVDLFLENTFLVCQHITVVSSQHVMPPLRDKDGTVITVTASNILGQTFLHGWPGSNEPMVCWYRDDRHTSREI